MKNSVKPILIAVPTHELKEQIIRDAKNAGVKEICGTPDMNAYGISEEIIEEMNEIYRIGAGRYALKFLAEKLNHISKNDADYIKISKYLRDCKGSVKFGGHIITTHAKLLRMPESVLESHEVIIDEDILRTVLHTESVEIQKIKNIISSGIFPDAINSYLTGICMKRGYHVMNGLDVFSDEN